MGESIRHEKEIWRVERRGYLNARDLFSMLTRSIEGKIKELYTFGRQHVRLWSRALGTAERGATPTGIVLEPATKDR